MSREATVYIEKFGEGFVVVCNFQGLQLVTQKPFETYDLALDDMCKQVMREQIRRGTRKL